MNLRGDRPSHEVARSSFAERRRGRHSLPAAMSGLVAVAILALSGCKTGGTSSPLAWWPGSSKGPADNEKLASAPSFDGKVEKPSETQRPYPTTTTPQSYAVDGQKPASLASAPAATPAAAPSVFAGGNSPDAYGTRGAVAASNPTATASPATPGGVAAQVGPYQGWPAGGGPTATAPTSPPPSPSGPAAFAGLPATSPSTATPAMPATPPAAGSPATPPAAGSSAALGFGSASSMTPDALEPPARYADSRFGQAAAAAPSFSAAASSSSSATVSEPATEPSSRYSTSGASQFGSQPFAAAAAAAPAAFAASAPPPSPSDALPQAASAVGDPSAVPPQTSVNRLRAPSGSAGPSTPPARRPDPGYRPGGTSTYRPSQAIVGEPADDGPVRQASFQSPLR